MSISSISQSNVLGEDVLQMIFQHLDAKDLLKCEAVCRQWRDIFLAGTPWRRLYHRNIGRLRLWRKAQKELELDQKTLRTEQYRGICKDILQKVDRNWRRGHFTKLTCPVSSSCATRISINDDYVAWVPRHNDLYDREICAFLDTESMEISEITTYFSVGKPNTLLFRCSSEMLVSRHDFCSGNLEIVSRKKRWAVNIWDGLDEGEKKNLDFEFGNKLLVTYCHCEGSGRDRMRIWKMGNPPVLLHDRICKFRNLATFLKVDERFIVLCNSDETFYFISTETFEEFRTVSWKKNYYGWEYDRGLLFQFIYGSNDNDNIIRILDVASGTFYSDVRLPIRNGTERYVDLIMDQWASSNSRFVVIGWKTYESSGIFQFSHFSFYDLEAVKKPSSGRRCYLYTLQFQFIVPSFVMDESRIVFKGIHRHNESNVTVLDFADFVERKTSNLEDKHQTQMKIIFDPYVDSLPHDDAEMMDR